MEPLDKKYMMLLIEEIFQYAADFCGEQEKKTGTNVVDFDAFKRRRNNA